MLATLKFIVVEDKTEDRTEILNQLAQAGLDPACKLGTAGTYDECKALLEDQCEDLDLVFLDLNIPRNGTDPKPEDKHGTNLLELISSNFNRRAQVHIRVIIISGQDLANNEATKEMLLKHFEGTLVGIVQKAALPEMLKSNLKRLRKNPLAAGLRRLKLPLEAQWETLRDPAQPIGRRLEAARAIGIQICLNELDFREERRNSHPEWVDDLNSILKELESRFCPPPRMDKNPFAHINTPGGWGCFLWRGALIQHLYLLNSYRNIYAHLKQQPYANPGPTSDEWLIPAAILRRADEGTFVGQVVELVVTELLEWYLPWHEQVYLPWLSGIK